jgi:outer membrane protein assembly factor BamB/tRNA A-37 threonylcarbamoyl transferase component Bud32
VPAQNNGGNPFSYDTHRERGNSAVGRLPDDYLLEGRYRILGVRGVGGMSIVYKARDLRFANATRLCVVKEMRNTATDPELRSQAIRNFEREANILADLVHPGIIQVYDYFTEDESCYLVTEFVDGNDLEAILAATPGFLPEETVVEWAIQICEVLRYLHTHKPHPIIFRDMKPSNIMVDRFGHVKLIDFGIARVFQDRHKGTMVGTEGYSPPEQYRGIADQRSDVYALGASLHHLLTKQDPRLEPPFSFQERPVQQANPDISDGMVAIVHRAVEYDVVNRFATIEQIRTALLQLKEAHTAGPTSEESLPFSAYVGPTELWRFACEDEIRSMPQVHNGVVYVTSYDSNLYALRAADGQFLWKYPTDESIGASPAIQGGQVFVGSSDNILYAISTSSGRIQWTCPTQGSIWSSPCVAFGHVLFGSDDGQLYAANEKSGRVAWSFQADGKIRSSPEVADDLIIFGSELGVVYAIDITGKAKWRFQARRAVTSSPCVADGLTYVGSTDHHVYCLDVNSGWSVWRYRTAGAVISSPVVAEGIVYVGSADQHIYALKADTGDLLWRFATNGQVASSPYVAEGSLYVGSTDGQIYSLDTRSGSLRWKAKTDGLIISSPIVALGVVYIGSSDHYLYAFPADA